VNREHGFHLAPFVGKFPWWHLLDSANEDELLRAEKAVGLASGELAPLVARAAMARGSAAEIRGTIKVSIDATRAIGFETNLGGLRLCVITRRRPAGGKEMSG
jgi:hypothetical protein